MPISEKQLAANRANAAQSTGPRTPEGKARSCQNARTHGFTASTFAVVRLEEFDEIARLKHDLLAVYQPVNSQELFALEQMALAQQTMFRAARLESGIFTTCLDMALNHDGTPFTPMSPELIGDCDIEIARVQNRNYALADGFHRLARKDNTFPLFLRYKIQTERLYRRAVEEFDRLKKLRPELPNEPILEVQPEENEPPCAPTDEPISTPQPNPEPAIPEIRAVEPAPHSVGQADSPPPPFRRRFGCGHTARWDRRFRLSRPLAGVSFTASSWNSAVAASPITEREATKRSCPPYRVTAKLCMSAQNFRWRAVLPKNPVHSWEQVKPVPSLALANQQENR